MSTTASDSMEAGAKRAAGVGIAKARVRHLLGGRE